MADVHGEGSPWDKASFFGKWTFSVINDTLALGMTRTLDYPDLMDFPQKDKAHVLKEKLKKLYFDGRENKHWVATYFPFIPHLLICLLRLAWVECLIVTFYTILEGLVRISLPLILIFLLRALEAQKVDEAYLWAGILSIVSLSQTAIHHVLFFFSMRAGWNWKISCTALIYEGLFELQYGGALAATMTGRMMNLISNDVAKFEEFAVFACFTWEAFLEVAIILLILIYILDIPSAFAGVGCTFLFIPFMTYLAQFFAYYRGLTAQATDTRIRYIGEVIEGIMPVKAYTWEKSFFLYISSLRVNEMLYISKSQFLRSINQALMFCTPAIISFVTFVVYWALGGTLTVPKVFSTISLLQVLRMTIGRQWTRSIETGSEAVASCTRIEEFLKVAFPISKAGDGGDSGIEKKSNTGEHIELTPPKIPAGLSTQPILHIKQGSYYYNDDPSTPTLHNINLSLQSGDLLMVVGPVGSGKSSLLSAILGEMKAVSPAGYEFSMAPGIKVAYAAQAPFILAASVKANIVLARSTKLDDITKPDGVDEELYAKAVETCSIVEDLMQWPAFDDTEIGERGVSVSGGQKARISLARTIYSDADLIILDDPLSAVDAHVGKSIMQNCIQGHLVKNKKTVVLVTHQLQYLHCASKILVLNRQGVQVFYGSYEELKKEREVLLFLLGESKQKRKVSTGSDHTVGAKAGAGQSVEITLDDLVEDDEDEQQGEEEKGDDDEDAEAERRDERGELVRSSTYHTKNYRMKSTMINNLKPTAARINKPAHSKATTYQDVLQLRRAKELQDVGKDQSQIGKTIVTEDKAVGIVNWYIYYQYLLSGNLWFGVLVISLILMSQALLMITDYWVNWWAVTKFYPSQDNSLYVIIFAILVFLCIIVGFLRALMFFTYTRQCANTLHSNCLYAVLHSPLQFFTSNPTGRILNRFTKDQSHADESLPVLFFSFSESFIYCISGVVLVCISLPYLILLLPPLVYCFSLLRNKYLCTTREVKRLEAMKRSEQFTHFQSTLQGLMTFRCYNMKDRCKAAFVRILNEYGRIYWTFLMSSRWLGFRLDLETNIILIAVCFVAVGLSRQVGDGNVSLVGFTLTYIIQLSGLFQWTVRQSAEIETQMTSIERIFSYSQLPAEPGYVEKIQDVLSANVDVYEGRDDSITTLCRQYHIPVANNSRRRSTSGATGAPSGHDEQYYDNSWLNSCFSGYGLVKGQDRQRFSSTDGAVSISTQSLPSIKAEYIKELSDSILKGGIRLSNVTATYRMDLLPVLEDFNLTIAPGTKVGICGRTGSGKSSLLLTLLRLNFLLAGDIFLDQINLTKIDIEVARKLITLIPQEPYLFSGTLRYNLDPFSIYSDEQILDALEQAHISSVLYRSASNYNTGDASIGEAAALRVLSPSELRANLSLAVEEHGDNFSIGEKQLISLSRAILNHSKVILMDEVTANIDYVTDELIQNTLRTSPALRSCTIITIAHRLRTIADYDRIIVMDKGKVVEDNTPKVLLETDGSLFRKLAEQSGELEEIKKIAERLHH